MNKANLKCLLEILKAKQEDHVNIDILNFSHMGYHNVQPNALLELTLVDNFNIKDRYIQQIEEFIDIKATSIEWYFLFSSAWIHIDNTIEGAINRLETVIEGTMKEHKHFKQLLPLLPINFPHE